MHSSSRAMILERTRGDVIVTRKLEDEETDEINRIERKFLEALDNISPDKLKSISHSKYVKKLIALAQQTLNCDSTRLLLILAEIKACRGPCYKRDFLLEMLENLLSHDGILLDRLLCKPFKQANPQNAPWKEFANALSAVPDLVANCGAIDMFPKLSKRIFYKRLVVNLYTSIERLAPYTIYIEHKMFFLQLLGRIAISGESLLVWEQFTSRAIDDNRSELKLLISSILTLPHSKAIDYSDTFAQFEIFTDYLYLPIFHNLRPSKYNGSLIRSLLAGVILDDEHFKYLLCDKSILRSNYNLDRRRRSVFLLNTFAYLSSFENQSQTCNVDGGGGSAGTRDDDSGDGSGGCGRNVSSHSKDEDDDDDERSLIVETLQTIAQSWSNSTKILLRTYEHNRYITCAFLLAFKYALESDRSGLTKSGRGIQSLIIRAIPFYLNRASNEQRNLAMCLGELILPRLHELIGELSDGAQMGGSDKGANMIELKFDVQYNDDLLQFQQLFTKSMDEIFQDFNDDDDGGGDAGVDIVNDGDEKNKQQQAKSGTSCSPLLATHSGDKNGDDNDELRAVSKIAHKAQFPETKLVQHDQRQPTQSDSNAAGPRVVELDGDDNDDLKAYLSDEDEEKRESSDDEDSDDDAAISREDAGSVPIYLRDCIDGLNENASARFVKLCLVRTGELLQQIVEIDAANEKERTLERYNASATSSRNQLEKLNKRHLQDKNVVDTVRDVSVELACSLLYFDNQYNIDCFDAHRMRALCLLCAATPDLVAKYLVEEFNGSSSSLRHKLDILQILVASARYLSGESSVYIREISNHSTGGCGGGSGDGGSSCSKGDGGASNKRTGYGKRANDSIDKETIASATGTAIDQRTTGKSNTRDIRIGSEKINKFASFAPLYFYGIVYGLKADLNNCFNQMSLVSTQPGTIVSALRDQQNPSPPQTPHWSNATNRNNQLQAESIVGGTDGSMSEIDSPRATKGSLASNKNTNNNDRPMVDRLIGEASKVCSNNGDNTLGDDSYLLSRILFSIALIINCCNHQPIACKLSSDLLDILNAYKCHPDPGVQGALITCLKVIRDCTPSVYYVDNLEKRLVGLLKFMDSNGGIALTSVR